MGREWLYKATAGSGGGGAGGGGGASPSTRQSQSMNKKSKRERNNSSSTSGCMSAFFKLFDIQNHQFRFHHPSFISESTINNNPQGVEAPRNSLQSPESMVEVLTPPPPPASSKKLERSNLNIPMGGIQIKTKRSRLTEIDLSSECSSSPSTKTPNLVARLMGLDLLPEYSSPRPSSSSTPATTIHHRTRSLPATPRTSTASRRSTDNDYHHRLSLQIDNKENCNTTCRSQERRRSELPVNRKDHEERSKEIANQVRERISRRLGTDITNTITKNNEQRRDSNLVLLKPKKQAPDVKTKPDHDSVTFSSSSPKLRLLDINNNLNRSISYSQQPKPSAKSASFSASIRNTYDQTAKSASFSASIGNTHDQTPLAKKCKRLIASERYDLRLKKEVFVNKKKSTPLRNHVVNVTNNTTKFLSFKKEMMSSSSSSSTTRLPQKQVSLVSMTQLPSTSSSSLNLNSSYNSNDTRTLNLFSFKDSNSATSSSASATNGRRRFSDPFAVIEDIDGLISRDMDRSMRRPLAAEAEEMVAEIEGEIVERMVDEMAMEIAMVGWV